MFRITLLAATLFALSSATTLNACDITGNVPSNIRKIICQVATSVDGGDEPVNRLTLMLKRSIAEEVSSKSMDAKNFMLSILTAWKNGRNVKVARVDAFYQRVHLATAKTNVFSDDSVEFH